jgi:hypothetical protein
VRKIRNEKIKWMEKALAAFRNGDLIDMYNFGTIK